MSEAPKDKRVFMSFPQEFEASLLLDKNLILQADGFWTYVDGASDASVAKLVSTEDRPITPEHIKRRREELGRMLRPKDTPPTMEERVEALEARVAVLEEGAKFQSGFNMGISDRLDDLVKKIDAAREAFVALKTKKEEASE